MFAWIERTLTKALVIDDLSVLEPKVESHAGLDIVAICIPLLTISMIDANPPGILEGLAVTIRLVGDVRPDLSVCDGFISEGNVSSKLIALDGDRWCTLARDRCRSWLAPFPDRPLSGLC